MAEIFVALTKHKLDSAYIQSKLILPYLQAKLTCYCLMNAGRMHEILSYRLKDFTIQSMVSRSIIFALFFSCPPPNPSSEVHRAHVVGSF